MIVFFRCGFLFVATLFLLLQSTTAEGETVKELFQPILGRPTDRSIGITLLPSEDGTCSVEYGMDSGHYPLRTSPLQVQRGQPANFDLTGLNPSQRYFYRVCFQTSANDAVKLSPEYSFHTARRSGESFAFSVHADAHNGDANSDTELYLRALANTLAFGPDFLMDLGDTFMTEKLRPRTLEQVQRTFLDMRPHFATVCNSLPLFLVNGNHDGECGSLRNSAGNGLAEQSRDFRQAYFPCPTIEGFFSIVPQGREARDRNQAAFAWTWGDALFVTLDPYWNTSKKPRGGERIGWNPTLGKAQYDWLLATLRGSEARFKFIFIHQIVGGIDRSGRGGAEAAELFEWGGRDEKGRDRFAAERPTWEKPIHSLLVETGVTIVFHGHDHFYARQERDGVIYQLVPQPAMPNYSRHHAEEYGYRDGVTLPGAGFLGVTVRPDAVTVDYIAASLESQGGRRRNVPRNNTVLESYRVERK